MSTWYEPLKQLKSKGSQAERPGSLAGLHAARAIHEGQFFTPDALAAWLWRLADQVIRQSRKTTVRFNREAEARVAIWDNSIGSGRLVQFAQPDQHEIYGCDVDGDAVNTLSAALKGAGFTYDVKHAGMDEVRAGRMTIALLNPPFSVQLSSPTLEPFASNAFGAYGPNTSAVSHRYSIEQALAASQVVLAIVPATFAEEYVKELGRSERLRALYRLPPGLFREESTDVRVSVLAFTSAYDGSAPEIVVHEVQGLDDPVPMAPVKVGAFSSSPRVTLVDVDESTPSITLPVTGDKTVRVVHDGRRIQLRFNCGLTQAKVLNAVYESRAANLTAEGHRLPKGVVYKGQGLLDVEQHVVQENPLASFGRLVRIIKDTGSNAIVDAGLKHYLARRIKQAARESTPFRHVVRGSNPNAVTYVTGVAKSDHLVDKSSWTSPVVKMGTTYVFTPVAEDRFRYLIGDKSFEVTRDEMIDRFEVTWPEPTDSPYEGWYIAHKGRRASFPQDEQFWRHRARRLGIDTWLGWDFQLDDAIELLIGRRGSICAWQQGAGKARLSVALCLLGADGPGLISMPAHLVLETAREIRDKLPLLEDDWQIIDSPEKLSSLKRVNLISLTRLRMPVARGASRSTYAKKLRRRIKVMVTDEGDMLANSESEQSRAIAQVSPRRLIAATGTPIASYPRNILPIMQQTGGDGTAGQRFGEHRGFIQPNLITAQQHVMRGVDAFREAFVETVWVTNEFKESMTEGAKREIPRISNLSQYRKAIAPHVLRRLIAEPDCAKHIKIKPAVTSVTTVPWDARHLGLYLKTAHEFAAWYRQARGDGTKQINLITLLARINAVVMVNNVPQHNQAFGSIGGLTSKQRASLARLKEWTSEGRKSIFFAHNPEVIDIMHRELTKAGIDSVPIHGGYTIAKRTKELDERFRYGDAPILLATVACAQSGYNLPMASRAVMYDRDWRSKVEQQAIARMLRHDQKEEVFVEFFQLQGGIDEYQQQMVEFKSDAAAAGLDWATPQNDEVEFLHLDTILHRFVENLVPVGMNHRDYYEALLQKGGSVEELLEATQ